MIFPLFVAREKTKHALDQAFQSNREVVLVIQRDDAVEEPGSGDVYEKQGSLMPGARCFRRQVNG
jgi:ATP-dependent Lon protease